MFERRLYYHIDWALLIAILALCALGVMMIYSTSADPTRVTSHLYITQLYAIGLGVLALLFTLTLDYRTFTDKSHLIYIGLLGLLLYVMFFGMVQMGARRWIAIRGFNLQPSEFAKVGVALVLAKFFGENRGAPAWTDLFVGGTLTLIPFALIAKEPDLGGGHAAAGVSGGRPYLAGMRMRILGVLFRCLLAAPVAWRFALKDYQKTRISTFLDPSQDAKAPATSRSRRASPSGPGTSGQGIQEGDAGPVAVPARRPQRFHFLGAGRGAGVAGVLVALGLYLFVILRTLRQARLAKDRLGSYRTRRPRQLHLPGGLQHHHVGRTGAVKGLTLPLMSYGGRR